MEDNFIPTSEKLLILNFLDSTFYRRINHLKGKERTDFINKEFMKIPNVDLVIETYNDECMEEDYNLGLNDMV